MTLTEEEKHELMEEEMHNDAENRGEEDDN